MPHPLVSISRWRIFYDPGVTYVLAAAYFLAGWSYFADPTVVERTPVGQAFHPVDATWNALYLLAGLLAGCHLLLSPARRYEEAALCALLGAWLINAFASFSVQGVTDLRSYFYVVFMAAAGLRLGVLRRAARA